MNSQAKGPKRMVTNLQWLFWKLHDNWVAYFKIWSRRSLQRFYGRAQTYGSQSDVFIHQRRVASRQHSRPKSIAWNDLPRWSSSAYPNAPKMEDRSQEETERQERCAREAAWKLAKNILKLKEKDKTAFFSLSENGCLPAPSTLKPEEREFVVDFGASMHRISKKDLNSAELETVTTSRSPMTLTTAHGEVQTNEEATVYVRELDIFLTMKLLEDTLAVLSLVKLCDEHGYSYEWINGQKPHPIENGIRIQCNTENFVPAVVPGLSTTSSSSSTSTSTTLSGQEIDHSDHHPAIESSECVDRQARRDPFTSETPEELFQEPTEIPKPDKKEDHEEVRRSPYSDIPEWLQEFRENLVDERVPEHRDSHARSSHEPSLDSTPARSADLGKHSVYTHFPKDRNCEICQRSKITRAPCGRRIGRVVLLAEILVIWLQPITKF